MSTLSQVPTLGRLVRATLVGGISFQLPDTAVEEGDVGHGVQGTKQPR